MKSHMSYRYRSLTHASCSALLLVLAIGSCYACEKKSEEPKAAPAKEAASASGEPKTELEPELSRAMKSATQGNQGTAPGSQDGPPQSGIFEPGAADAQVRVSDPPKITLGSEGSTPRLKLGGEIKGGEKRLVTLKLALDIGASQLPVDLTLALETKADVGAMKVSAKITAASLAAEAGSSPEAKAAFGSLKGSEISYFVAPNGAPSRFGYKASSAKGAGLIQVLIAAKDALASIVQPFPDKAVGAEALWMVTARQGVWDLDMVTYQMVKVKEVSGDTATLSIDSKRYAASPSFVTPFVQADAPLSLYRFEAPGQAQITLRTGDFFPVSASVSGHVAAAVGPVGGEPAAADRAQVVQASWTAELTTTKKP